jgi:hypothetical protein
MSSEQLAILKADPKSFLDRKWPAPLKETMFAGSLTKAAELTPQPVSAARSTARSTARPRSASSTMQRTRTPPVVQPTSFMPFRVLPLPEPLPGNWRIKTQYAQGAFQLGVINYPYTPADRGAKADLDGIVHGALDHPSIPLTMWNGTSSPHNTITGRATTSRYGMDLENLYKSEMKRAYEIGDFKAWFEAKAGMHSVGVRSEQKIGVGI